MKRRNLLLALILILGTVAASAQEFRATITGRVLDQSGAVIPKAKIIVQNTDTGVKSATVSGDAGYYTAPFLLPGMYSITTSSPGFSTNVRNGIKVETGAKLGIDITLAVGSMNQEVKVTSDAPLIQTETATAGQVLTTQEIEDLPDNGRSPLALARTEYGVIAKQKHSVTEARPFDNSGASDFSIGGGNSQSNELLLNGVPNMQDSSRVAAYSPLQDSVSEIRVDVFESDASYGDTSGGTVNMTTKAGTNQFHGTLSEFNQFSAIDAPPRWFTGGAKQPVTRQNQYGGTIGGPVLLPKLFNGRDKLFFFYAYEGFKGSDPGSKTTTVPTAAERKGDFSALLALGPGYQFYDPATTQTTTVNGKVTYTRQPIVNNIITRPLNPVAAALLKYYPLPNQPGAADGENNYFSNTPTIYDYSSNQGRLDYSINTNNKLFFEIHRSYNTTTQSNIFRNIATGNLSINNFWGGSLDYIHTFSPSLTADTRLGFSRSANNNSLPSQGFDATTLGFPEYINTFSTERALPRINPSEFETLSTKPGSVADFDTIQLFSAITKVAGRHTIKIGPDIRANKLSKLSPGYSSGSFQFTPKFFNQKTNAPSPTYGSSFAAFLLGIPTSSSSNSIYDINTPTTSNNWYFAGFIQDDWKAASHLTINLGLRLEHETPIVESNNRAVVAFDPTVQNAVTSAAIANYKAKPQAQLPVSNFQPTGGIYFATADHRNAYNTPTLYVSPRLGVSFAPPIFNDRTVIRGGVGLFDNPFNDYNTSQTYGYSQSNVLIDSLDGATPAASLSDPFPAGNPLIEPTGSSLGINTNLGNKIQFVDPNVKVPYSIRWNLDVQQQLTKNLMIDVGYIGNHQVHMSYSNAISSTPLLPFLSHSSRKDVALSLAMGTSLTGTSNPFSGLLPGTSYNSSITTAQLLQAYPQYTGVTQALVPGASAIFHELLVRVQKRMSHGLTMNLNYEWSHGLITTQLNDGGPLVYGASTSDFPNHLSITGNYVLPVGRGKALLGHANRAVDLLIGGFTVNTIYQYLSGAPLQWGNVAFANGTSFDSKLKIQPRAYNGAFDTSLFYTGTGANIKNDPTDTGQPNSYNYRTFPQYYGRQDATNNLDASILKDFHISERVRVQYRFEAFNVLNHTSFGPPNLSPTSKVFGTINSTSSTPRTLQQGIRVVF